MKFIYTLIILTVLTSCGTTTIAHKVDNKPHITKTTSFCGIPIIKNTEPVKSHTDQTRDYLSSYGKYAIMAGIAIVVASFAFSAAIKSYTGQDIFNGIQIGGGCTVMVGIALVQLASWWWYIVVAAVCICLYIAAKMLKDKGVF